MPTRAVGFTHYRVASRRTRSPGALAAHPGPPTSATHLANSSCNSTTWPTTTRTYRSRSQGGVSGSAVAVFLREEGIELRLPEDRGDRNLRDDLLDGFHSALFSVHENGDVNEFELVLQAALDRSND